MKADSRSEHRLAGRRVHAGAAKRKKQLALIGVLVLVLILAIVTSPSSDKPHAVPDIVPNVALVSLKSNDQLASADDNTKPMENLIAVQNLNSLAIEQINATDLFRRPYISPYAKRPEITPIPSTPKSVKVGAVYGSYDSGDHTALINGEIVQPGMELEPGIKVLTVSPEGVEVAP